jgi:hypothetical protein
MGLAAAFSASELALTEQQAEAYAAAASDVMSHYDMGATAKTIAWVNLLAAMGGIYWQKIGQISARKAGEKAARVKAAVSPLIPRTDMHMGAMA